MSTVTERVAGMAAARRVHLPAIRTRIADWRRAGSVLPALARAIDDLREHPGIPPAVARQLDWIRLGDNDLGPAITAAVRDLQRLECRLQRDTVTIGVGGPTSAGKSTVLQSITGLDDDVLPTADRSPATAVRCRIHHVPGRRRALLDLHTFDTFRSAHLLPRHVALGLAAT